MSDDTSSLSLWEIISRDRARYNDKRQGMIGTIESFMFAPGFATILRHRIAVRLYRGGKASKLFGLLIWRHNISVSSCHLSLKSQIDPGLFLPHPTGVVIGDGVHVGPGVTIYQGVTLGMGSDGRYPKLHGGVTIYPGTIVIGGIAIGASATIGANSFVSKSVAAGMVVAGAPAHPVSNPQ